MGFRSAKDSRKKEKGELSWDEFTRSYAQENESLDSEVIIHKSDRLKMRIKLSEYAEFNGSQEQWYKFVEVFAAEGQGLEEAIESAEAFQMDNHPDIQE